MNWKNMPLSHKIATVISGIAVLVWLIQHVKPNILPVDLTYPAVSVFTLCEAVIYWNKKRTWSYLLIAAAVISLASFLLEFFL